MKTYNAQLYGEHGITTKMIQADAVEVRDTVMVFSVMTRFGSSFKTVIPMTNILCVDVVGGLSEE